MIGEKKLLNTRDFLRQFKEEKVPYRVWKDCASDKTQQAVYMRVNKLAELGLLEKSREKSRPGPLKKFYVLTDKGRRFIELADGIEALVLETKSPEEVNGRG